MSQTSALVKIQCDGILCDNEFEINLPGWLCRNDDIELGGDSSYLFCQRNECQEQAKWFDAQCPGCVTGFPECGLGRSFGHSDSKGLTAEQEKQIRAGTCPFRINGSFGFSRETGFQELHLDEPAVAGPGDAVVDAIHAYLEKYPPRHRS